MTQFSIEGGGEMGELMRSIDWHATPVGPMESWPLSLTTAIRIVLQCKLPMYIAWGKENTQFYNDAYRPILGDKHPRAMGTDARVTWPEIWPTIGPMWEEVRQGKSIGFDDFKLTINRFGYPEDCYFNFSYSPVPDDSGAVAGILVTFAETTQKVFLEQRQAFHLDVADRQNTTSDPQGVITVVSEKLGHALNAGRVGYAEINAQRDTVFVSRDWTDGEMPSLAGQERPLSSFGPNIIDVLRSGQTLKLDDISADPRSAPYADGYASIGTKSLVVAPLVRDHTLVAILYVHEASVRRWTANETTLIEEAANRTWADIERARMEEFLHAERERSHHIMQSMAEGFALLDYEFKVLQINQEALRYERRPAQEILGRSHWEVWPGTEFSELGQMYKRAMEERIHGKLEHRYEFPDGRSLWLEVDAYPVNDGLALFYRDVTERKNSVEALRLANRRKDEFLAMLSHELRNPLAPISAAAELLQSPIGEAGIQKTSAIISRQVRHLTNLVDDLLDVSRVTRGLVAIAQIPVDMQAMIASAVEQARPLITGRRHQLEITLPGNVVKVTGDEKRLIQAVANLLNNAAKYTRDGGNITLRLVTDGPNVIISVSDNGIGMAPDLLNSAFELFVQAQRSPDRSQGGLGLGLALVKSIVELHGGTVHAASSGIGKGSTLTVTLPRLVEQSGPEPEESLAHNAPPDSLALRILVVDDNADAASTLAMCLESRGHSVDVAYHGNAVLERIAEQSYDVFMVDIGLPEIDGYVLARRIKEKCPNTPLLIAVTGYGSDEDRDAGKKAGFDYYLIKPVDSALLATMLASRFATTKAG